VFVALGTQHTMRMRQLSSVTCPALQCFSVLSPKGHDFRNEKKKVTERKTCVLIFSRRFVRNVSHSKKNRVRCGQKRTSGFMWTTRYSSQILIKLEFSRQIFEKHSNIKMSLKSRPVRAELFQRTDGHTDMTKLTVFLRNFANAPKIYPISTFMLWQAVSQTAG